MEVKTPVRKNDGLENQNGDVYEGIMNWFALNGIKVGDPESVKDQLLERKIGFSKVSSTSTDSS